MKYRVERPEIEQPQDPSIRHIPLTRNQIAIVSTHRYGDLMRWNWSAFWSKRNQCFYAIRRSGSSMIYMHRYIAGNPPHQTDHENRNSLDNRDENLRPGTASQNGANRDKQSNNSSGYKGVFRNGRKGWMAKVAHEGTQHYEGTYTSKIEAARAYDRAAIKLFGKFARINFPHSDYL